jgi:hypothetical protein
MGDRNTPVAVLVGDDKHPFHLDEQQLCACSSFFRSVLTDGFKETLDCVPPRGGRRDLYISYNF